MDIYHMHIVVCIDSFFHQFGTASHAMHGLQIKLGSRVKNYDFYNKHTLKYGDTKEQL